MQQSAMLSSWGEPWVCNGHACMALPESVPMLQGLHCQG